MKIRNYWQESLLKLIRQNIAGWCQQTFCFQKFLDNAEQCFVFMPQGNFPANNLNFHWRWRWWDWIKAIFLNLFYFKHLIVIASKFSKIRSCCIFYSFHEYLVKTIEHLNETAPQYVFHPIVAAHIIIFSLNFDKSLTALWYVSRVYEIVEWICVVIVKPRKLETLRLFSSW